MLEQIWTEFKLNHLSNNKNGLIFATRSSGVLSRDMRTQFWPISILMHHMNEVHIVHALSYLHYLSCHKIWSQTNCDLLNCACSAPLATKHFHKSTVPQLKCPRQFLFESLFAKPRTFSDFAAALQCGYFCCCCCCTCCKMLQANVAYFVATIAVTAPSATNSTHTAIDYSPFSLTFCCSI